MRPLSLRTILVATDLSDAMMPALQTATKLAGLADASLRIVHVREKPGSNENLRAHLSKAGLTGDVLEHASAIEGTPAAAIVEEAFRVEADVIVLGPHRGGRTGSIGTTADRVVRAAPVPCLILPRGLPLPLAKVLIPVDAAESARGPLAVGMTWASALRQRPRMGEGTSIVALHVAVESDGSDAVQRLAREVEIVEQRVASLAKVHLRQVVVASGDPPDAILKYAGSEGVDLVVLGTRAQKPVDDSLLGSVSSAVVSSATMPVLLVPPAVWRSSGREPLP